MLTVRTFSELLAAASKPPLAAIAVAGAYEIEVLESAVACRRMDLAQPILVGPEARTRQLAAQAQLDLAGCRILDCAAPDAVAQATVDLVRSGQAQVAVKGLVSSSTFLHAALDRSSGLRTDRLVSHVGVFQVPGFPRLLCISDGGVVLYPTREQQVEIIRNAIAVARTLGIARPRVALVAGTNEAAIDRPVACELASLAAMRTLWQSEEAWVDGPFAPDVAVDPAAAAAAGAGGEVAGQADVLVGPTLEATNTMCKGITYFAGGQMAGIVVGTRAPLALGSRSDPAETRLACIAIGVLYAKSNR
ncbi:MAG TPA: phosphate acyltransferase [Anaerolineae bacterium]|nr:phosphate acyltransferase [Anaerolineae bacterium]HOR01168.1 phosphate acyltransferase [Anaerolineae bacterium]HPL28636.1 phosphate acyltransferase [Anaerolineae bacterium]